MFNMENAIPTSSHRITDVECQRFMSMFEVNDDRGPISLLDAMLGQLHAHWFVASKSVRGKTVNIYSGDADGNFGPYPIFDKNSPIIDEKGFFERDRNGNFKGLGGRGARIGPDAQRINENSVLTALHLMVADLHDNRLREHGDYNRAKSEVVACFQHAFMDMTVNVTGLTPAQIMNEVVIEGFANNIEFAMAVGRYGHAMMPETIAGNPLFSKSVKATDIDLVAMADEKAGRMGLRISAPMANGSEGGKGKNILNHTIENRHNKHNLCTWGEMVAYYAARRGVNKNRIEIERIDEKFDHCPIFVGMLEEADKYGDGKLGPVGARAVADGMASTFMWAMGTQEGLYHPRWEGAPSTALEIAKYVR